jgi:carbon storage regulator
MLVLSRKVNEKIVIDGDIVVTVVKVEGGQVRLGIEAPGHVKIFRQEILGKVGRTPTHDPLVAAGV